MSDRTSKRPLLPRPIVGAVAVVSATVSILLFGAAGRDDSYITFWEAQQLADHGRLVNVNGAHLEQSSSLAHVLVLAVLHLVTRISFPFLAVIVGALCLIITICLAARVADELRAGTGVATSLLCAVAFPLMYWSTGGLETLLASVAVLWFTLTLTRVLRPGRHATSSWVAFVASAVLIVTVRPDTMIVAAAVAVVVVVKGAAVSRWGRFSQWTSVFNLGNAWRAAASVIGAAAVLAIFRVAYFHSVLPQPDLVKSGGFSTIGIGAHYLATALPWWVSVPLLLAAVAGVGTCIRARHPLGVIATVVLFLGMVSLLFTRGDWMGGARLLVPYLPIAVALAVVGVAGLHVPVRRTAFAVALAGECALLIAFANGALWLSPSLTGASTTNPTAIAANTGAPAWANWQWPGGTLPSLPWYIADNGIRERDAEFLQLATPIVRTLVDALAPGQTLTIASSQAGYVIYAWATDFSGRLHFYDTANIVTSNLENCRGVYAALAGEIMTYGNWASHAGGCAPPLPDVIFDVGTIDSYPALTTRYHVVVSANVLVHRGGLGAYVRGGGPEFLAVRDGWTPGQSSGTTPH